MPLDPAPVGWSRDVEFPMATLSHGPAIDHPPETKNTWHRPDPSFTYLLSFFLLLTAFAWGLAYTPSFGAIFRLTFLFVFVHFIGSSLLISTIGYFIIGKLFGPDGAAASLAGLRGSRGRRRGAAQGLFMQPGEKDQLEFGYCFDVRMVPQCYGSCTNRVLCRYPTVPSFRSTSTCMWCSSFCCLCSLAARVISWPPSWETHSTSRPSSTTPISLSWDIMRYLSCTTLNFYWRPSSFLLSCG